jgi:CRP-like cAMP-binding protein
MARHQSLIYTMNPIFRDDDTPKYYFQIVNGSVELNNYHLDGKEFTQNILSTGQSIGESFLFGDNPYPMNAYAKTDCMILKLLKDAFFNLINQNSDALIKMLKYLSEKLHQNHLKLFTFSSSDPLNRIKTLMNNLKSSDSMAREYPFQIPLTRQQLANMTGLRVEAVIRTIKKMEKYNMLKIKNGKILYY